MTRAWSATLGRLNCTDRESCNSPLPLTAVEVPCGVVGRTSVVTILHLGLLARAITRPHGRDTFMTRPLFHFERKEISSINAGGQTEARSFRVCSPDPPPFISEVFKWSFHAE